MMAWGNTGSPGKKGGKGAVPYGHFSGRKIERKVQYISQRGKIKTYWLMVSIGREKNWGKT